MTEETQKETKNQKCQRVLNNWLYVKYPDIFNHKKPKPLAIGTTKVLQQELPEGISVEDLKLAIGYHCRMQTYLRAVLIESHRVNLQGEPVAEIPLEDKKSAKDNLERVHKQQLESYLKRFLPATETPDVASAEPKVTPVVPEFKVTSEPVAEKVIVAEPVTVASVVEEVKPKKLTLKPKTPPVETTPIQAQPVENSGDCAKSRGLKVTLVLDPASIPNIDSTGMKKVPLKVQIGEDGLIATTELSSKSYRKALNSIEEYGVERCNAILQGAMKQYGVIEDAGLVVQPKKTASG
jgi:sRNA-binding protein